MKAVVVAAMLMACAVASPLEEHQRMFADFKAAHGRKYATEEEELKRFRVFSDNMKRAEELNRSNPLARFGSNVFADLTAAEFKSRHNGDVTRVPKRKSAPIAFGASTVRDATGQSIDWRIKGAVTPVKDQGACGSGWAFAATGSIEGQWYLSGPGLPLTALSEQELVSCYGGCGNGYVSGAVDWLVGARIGEIVTEAAYPFSSGTSGVAGNCSSILDVMAVGAEASGQRDISHDENQMAAFVYTTGPLSVLVDASQWQLYNGGIMSNCSSFNGVDHAVLITGFNDTEGSWTIKNSWGANWGEAGYIRVQKGTNQCFITKLPTTAIVGTIVPPPAPTTTTPPPPPAPPTTTSDKGCNANLPAASFNIPQLYNGNSESFDWLISLSAPSTNTPAGDAACASGVYIGQYTPGLPDPAACITAAPTTTPNGSDGSCNYSLTQTDGSITYTYAVTVKCDRSATTLTPPAAITVTAGAGQGSFIYTGTFASSQVCI